MYFIHCYSSSRYLKRVDVGRKFLEYDESEISNVLSLEETAYFVFTVSDFDEIWPELSKSRLFMSPKLNTIFIHIHCENYNQENVKLILDILSRNRFIQLFEYLVPNTSSFTLRNYETDPFFNAISNNLLPFKIQLVINTTLLQSLYIMYLVKSLISNNTIKSILINYIDFKNYDIIEKCLFCKFTTEIYQLVILILDHNDFLDVFRIEDSFPGPDTELQIYRKLLYNAKNKNRKSLSLTQLVSKRLTF